MDQTKSNIDVPPGDSFPIYPEEQRKSLLEKAKDNPMFPIGIVGGIGALIYSARKFKNRGNTKVSVYLIHTRMAAQGAVVGAVTLGVLYSIFKESYSGKSSEKSS